MLMLTLPISCLTISNLPWFVDLTFQVSMQYYYSLQHQTLLPPPDTSTTASFLLLLSLFISSEATSPLFPSSIVDAYLAEGIHFSVSYIFTSSYCSRPSQGKNAEVGCHFILQWTLFCQISAAWPIYLWWLYTEWLVVSLSFTRLWSMWSFWLVFCDCGFHSRAREIKALRDSGLICVRENGCISQHFITVSVPA